MLRIVALQSKTGDLIMNNLINVFKKFAQSYEILYKIR
jgi:hypothetical protein